MGKNAKVCGTCSRTYKEDADFLKQTSQWRVCSAGNLWFNCNCGSTLMLPKGKFPWYSPGLKMGPEAGSLFNSMSELQELPHISTSIMELQNLLTNEESEVGDLAKAVKKNPLIAADVLKVCDNLRRVRGQNGNGGKKFESSLEYAISFIGRKQLSNLVMVATMKKFELPTQEFDSQHFWEHSFQIAEISEFLWVRFFSGELKDAAYLAGCLCNIGKIVAAMVYPDKVDQMYREMNLPQTQSSWPDAEDRVGMHSHCILGEIGAAFWGFPAFVFEPIKCHHDPDQYPDQEKRDLIHIAAISNLISHWINGEPHRLDGELMEKEKKYFNLDDPMLDQLVSLISKVVPSLS